MVMCVVLHIFVYLLFSFKCFSTEVNVYNICVINNVIGKCIHASWCSEPTSESNYCGEGKGLHVFVCCPVKSFIPDGQKMGDNCTNDGVPGKCVEASKCNLVKWGVVNERNHGLNRCGFRETTEIVCCPYKFIDITLQPDVTYLSREEETCHKINERCVYADSCINVNRSVELKTHNFKRCGFIGTSELICCPTEFFNTTLENTAEEINERNDQMNTHDSEEVLIAKSLQGPALSDRYKFEDLSYPERKSKQACKSYLHMVRTRVTLNIINGHIASSGKYPHMAAIKMQRGSHFHTFCGGSLISKRHVLTAAHCVAQYVMEPQFVQLGVLNTSDISNTNVTMYKIQKSFIHPDYNRRFKYHDIAIIQLDREVIMDYETYNIFPACLNSDEDSPALNESLNVAGWGVTDIKLNIPSTILLETEVIIPDGKRCILDDKKLFPRGFTDGLLCALGHKNSQGVRGDACMGDSGGPLQACQYQGCLPVTIFGVTSFGFKCGTDRPGYYTRISKYLGWIEDIVWPSEASL